MIGLFLDRSEYIPRGACYLGFFSISHGNFPQENGPADYVSLVNLYCIIHAWARLFFVETGVDGHVGRLLSRSFLGQFQKFKQHLEEHVKMNLTSLVAAQGLKQTICIAVNNVDLVED